MTVRLFLSWFSIDLLLDAGPLSRATWLLRINLGDGVPTARTVQVSFK